jgi:hypothetical protein
MHFWKKQGSDAELQSQLHMARAVGRAKEEILKEGKW